VPRHVATQAEYPRSLVNGVWQFAPAVLAHMTSTSFGRYRLALEREYESDATGRSIDRACVDTQFVSARNLSLRRDLFWEIGGFDASFPFAGAEDQDLSVRARLAGALLLRNDDIRVLNNESIITFEAFCAREERSAQTLVVLARKLPAYAAERPVITRNCPPVEGESPLLVAAKLMKSVASRPRPLRALHALVAWLEDTRLPDWATWWWYRRVLGLHIFRGVRTASGELPSSGA
jgi:hypothetical protein